MESAISTSTRDKIVDFSLGFFGLLLIDILLFIFSGLSFETFILSSSFFLWVYAIICFLSNGLLLYYFNKKRRKYILIGGASSIPLLLIFFLFYTFWVVFGSFIANFS